MHHKIRHLTCFEFIAPGNAIVWIRKLETHFFKKMLHSAWPLLEILKMNMFGAKVYHATTSSFFMLISCA